MRVRIIPFIILLLLIVSCAPLKGPGRLTISSWNAYCFFDPYEDGTEYKPFRAEDGFSRASYEERIRRTVRYFDRYLSSSDLIILEEIESEVVLKDLLEGGLLRRGYRYYGLAKAEGEVFHVGFISCIAPIDVRLHRAEESRAILEVIFETEGEPIHVLGIHASSRLIEGNKSLRDAEFALIRSVIEENGDEMTIVIGDFNTDVRLHDGEEIGKDLSLALPVTGDAGIIRDGRYYLAALDRDLALGDGTYWWEASMSMLDNALLTKEAFDGIGWEYVTTSIIAPLEAKDRLGRPEPYDPRARLGYSDHFAITVELTYN